MRDKTGLFWVGHNVKNIWYFEKGFTTCHWRELLLPAGPSSSLSQETHMKSPKGPTRSRAFDSSSKKEGPSADSVLLKEKKVHHILHRRLTQCWPSLVSSAAPPVSFLDPFFWVELAEELKTCREWLCTTDCWWFAALFVPAVAVEKCMRRSNGIPCRTAASPVRTFALAKCWLWTDCTTRSAHSRCPWFRIDRMGSSSRHPTFPAIENKIFCFLAKINRLGHISCRPNGSIFIENIPLTCHLFKQGLHSRCPHGSSLTFLFRSSQILHISKVVPISQ